MQDLQTSKADSNTQSIVFLAHRVPYPPNKGEKIRTFNQLKFLSQGGHKISVLAPQESAADHEHLDFLTTHYCALPSTIKPTHPLKLCFGLLKNQALSVANFYSKALQEEFDTVLEKNEIDAVICTSSCMASYIFNSRALKSTHKKRPKLIMDFMDLDSDKWKQYRKRTWFPLSLIYAREASLLSKYEHKIYQHFDKSCFISQEEINMFLKGGTNNGKLLPIANGIDTDFFQPSPVRENIDAPTLLFTGVMDYLPNEDAVLWFCQTIWPDIIKQWPSAKFIIAGMSPSNSIKALASQPGIIVTGFVDDIRIYYEQADFFVAPFRIARGVQNKVLQAFASGLPVISTDMGNEGIDAKNTHEIFIANDKEAFLTSISKLSSDFELRKAMSKNALDLVKQSFSWQGQLENLENLLHES